MISDRLPRETLDAICAGVKRKRLAFDHSILDPGWDSGCEHGETSAAGVCYSPDCPGCVVALAAIVVANPSDPCRDGSRRWSTARAVFFESFAPDEFDPIRVTVERELARRGIQ